MQFQVFAEDSETSNCALRRTCYSNCDKTTCRIRLRMSRLIAGISIEKDSFVAAIRKKQ
ncbi:MAG: hypothetical protein JWM11_4964 [Planctomycetaceae bacterium]|nr:hypothetical protein [Planctomycetaceae bacterium]